MGFLNRKHTNRQSLPDEIGEYYQSERRERAGLSWLLTLFTLLLTAGLVVLIFLGGRWAYHKIGGNSKTPVATTETTEAQTDSDKQSTSTDEASSTGSGSSSSSSDTTNTTNTTNSSSESGDSTQTTYTQPQAEVNQPVATSGSTNLVDTGPGDIVSVASVVASIGYVVSVSRRMKISQ